MRRPLLVPVLILSMFTLTACGTKEGTDGLLGKTDAYILSSLKGVSTDIVDATTNVVHGTNTLKEELLTDLFNWGRGEVISDTEEVVQVLIKNRDTLTVTVIDVKTDDIVEIQTSLDVFNSVIERQEIKVNKRVHKDKDDNLKAYYSILTTLYNVASSTDLENAEKVVKQVTVEVVDKTKMGTKSPSYYIHYRYNNDPYVTEEHVTREVYDSARIGAKVFAEKTDYTLKNGKKVTKFALLTGSRKE